MEILNKSLILLLIKKHERILLLVIYMSMLSQFSSYCVANDTEESIILLYHQYEKQLMDSNEFFKLNRKHLTPKIEKYENESEPEQYDIWGDTFACFWSNPIKVKIFSNSPLFHSLKDKKYDPYLLPHLTINQALEKGKQYLQSFDLLPTHDFELKNITFNNDWNDCWGVEWRRIANGKYAWDDFDKTLQEKLSVVFHEKYGLVYVDNIVYTPPPKKLLVKITKEQAIQKASQLAPLVFKTNFYRQARASGFVIRSTKSCELKVSIPNWLLDPKRAWWPRKYPPTETRLCWVVTFTTVDAKAAKRENGMDGKILRLIPPDILIYLDAETGECVGASCS